MKQHFTDERTDISYTLQGDYYLPDFSLPTDEKRHIGVWGQRRLRYLKEHHKVMYANLLTSGKLQTHLADTEEQAQEIFCRMVEHMAESEGVDEKIKEKEPMEWVRKMNNIRARAMEIVNNEIVIII